MGFMALTPQGDSFSERLKRSSIGSGAPRFILGPDGIPCSLCKHAPFSDMRCGQSSLPHSKVFSYASRFQMATVCFRTTAQLVEGVVTAGTMEVYRWVNPAE